MQDEQGVIHNANIIWGTSEKPQLGNAIELVVVATGFEAEQNGGNVMKSIIPPTRLVEPAREATAPVLEPVKKSAASPLEKPVRQPRANEQVILGERSTRYSNIDLLLAKPAYQSRKAKFIVDMPSGRKEVLRDEPAAPDAQHTEGSLFD